MSNFFSTPEFFFFILIKNQWKFFAMGIHVIHVSELVDDVDSKFLYT
jgi:hypothetical protein